MSLDNGAGSRVPLIVTDTCVVAGRLADVIGGRVALSATRACVKIASMADDSSGKRQRSLCCICTIGGRCS